MCQERRRTFAAAQPANFPPHLLFTSISCEACQQLSIDSQLSLAIYLITCVSMDTRSRFSAVFAIKSSIKILLNKLSLAPSIRGASLQTLYRCQLVIRGKWTDKNVTSLIPREMSIVMRTSRTAFVAVYLNDGKLAREFPRPLAASAKPAMRRVRWFRKVSRDDTLD